MTWDCSDCAHCWEDHLCAGCDRGSLYALATGSLAHQGGEDVTAGKEAVG